MADFNKIIEHIPNEKIRHTPTLVRANLTKAGWEVTMGIAHDAFTNDYFLHDKPHRAFLFLIDGEAFDEAFAKVTAIEALNTSEAEG
jgi:hypothetical protein